jgi:hypothetical protein
MTPFVSGKYIRIGFYEIVRHFTTMMVISSLSPYGSVETTFSLDIHQSFVRA